MPEFVAAWLEGLGLGQYAANFAEHEIGPDLLPDLSDEDLREIGVTALGHRKLILKAIASFQPGATANDDSTATPETESRASADDETTAWSRTPGERKPVTLLFADIAGSTALTEKLDAEEAHELVYHAIERMCQAIENNLGTVCRFMGDGVMAMFGAPLASERHALEACRAALEIQQRVQRYSARLRCLGAGSGDGRAHGAGRGAGHGTDDPRHSRPGRQLDRQRGPRHDRGQGGFGAGVGLPAIESTLGE